MGTRAGPKTGGRKPKTLTEAQKKAIRDTKQVTVKSGDTLTSIAKSKGTTVANLKKINPQIKDLNKIKPGQKIRVGGSDAYEKRIGQVSKSPDKPRTIAQAQKMGKKYFYDKNGKRKAAVTAEQLKKSGLTLSQWLKKK
jgi:LysM repeat protein